MTPSASFIEKVKLGDLLLGIEAGKNMRCDERPPRPGERGVVKVSAVSWGRFDPLQSKTLPEAYSPPERARIRRGDLLLSRANTLELVGSVVLVEEEPDNLFLSDKVLRLVLEEDDKRWVLWFLRSAEGRRQIEMRATGNQLSMRNISQEALREIELPYLGRAQSRIVANLDALTARLARARAEVDRVPVLAASLRLAALRQTFHWTDENLPAGWQRMRVDEIGMVQLGRQRSPKDHFGPYMRPYVRSANVTWAGWDLSDVKEMNFSPEEYETFSLMPGDVLLNEGSGSAKEVGKPAVWNGEIEGVCFQNTLLRVRPHAYLPQLLRYSLLYMALSGQFIQNTKGVNIIHIGKAGLAKTIIPVPPADEQGRLLETLEAAFARADRLEAEAARARALLDRLEAAILARAFRGELVPQAPDDEPASALLDRIRAQRAAAPKAKRGRKARELA